MFHSVNQDAFSSGQIRSKLWLCQELEKLFDKIDNIWIYGGWYGVTGFLLLSRENIKIQQIRSYDIDPECESVADMINENWVYKQWTFKAFTHDCNKLTPTLGNPDLIINTSSEHFETMEWWDAIPQGMMVVVQGNNMPHDDHHIHTSTLKQFAKTYPLSNVLYQGKLDFDYPTWSFTRFMTIGIK